ncbi:hypothetical protein HYALB_00006890 [Hymenoscyphus albidus]|uniref:Uncharacterized protein n=1 Tax=Hymenoscyphus albidus TaxID=595503 RepID=A0A9N9Q311_9HELO|nr:hypothetical protein HYALB_00006890 [Hymenoscyphus albidus]
MSDQSHQQIFPQRRESHRSENSFLHRDHWTGWLDRPENGKHNENGNVKDARFCSDLGKHAGTCPHLVVTGHRCRELVSTAAFPFLRTLLRGCRIAKEEDPAEVERATGPRSHDWNSDTGLEYEKQATTRANLALHKRKFPWHGAQLREDWTSDGHIPIVSRSNLAQVVPIPREGSMAEARWRHSGTVPKIVGGARFHFREYICNARVV